MRTRIPDRINEKIPKSVAIIGVGGIGSWTAMLLAQINQVERIGLFDEDVVEPSNLERTWYKLEDLGKKKSQALKEQIENRRTDVTVIAYDHLTEENKQLLNLYDLKIVCADKRSVRNMVLEKANSISAGYDVDEEKDYISVSEQQMWSLSGDDEDDGYTIEPSWSVPAMLGALLTVHGAICGERPITISSAIKDFYKRTENNQFIFSITEDEETEEEQEETEEEQEETEEEYDVEHMDYDDIDYTVIIPDEISSDIVMIWEWLKNEHIHPHKTFDDIIESHMDDVICEHCGERGHMSFRYDEEHTECEKCGYLVSDFVTYLVEKRFIPKHKQDWKCCVCDEYSVIEIPRQTGNKWLCTHCGAVYEENGDFVYTVNDIIDMREEDDTEYEPWNLEE